MIAALNVAKALLARWRVALFVLLLGGAAYGGYSYRDALADEQIAEYRRDQAEATAKQALAALHAAKKQERASEDAEKDYQKRLADLRAHYERRMRERTDGNIQRPVPAAPAAPGESYDTATELAACRADLEILEYDAAADALQLWELQQWLRAQQGVNE